MSNKLFPKEKIIRMIPVPYHMRSEVLAAAEVALLCSVGGAYQHSGGKCGLHLQ